MKVSYELQTGWTSEEKWPGWKISWKIKVQQHVKDCVWMLAHGRVLTSKARWRRKMSMSVGCPRCDGLVEGVLHAVRDCPKAKEI